MKKLICLLLAAVMLTSLSVCLFSCQPDNGGTEDDNTETKVNYTVTVTDSEGNPIKGAVVTFNPEGSTPVPFPTNAEGKASYKTDKDLSVTVTSVPKGYTYDKLGVAQSFDEDGNLEVKLSAVEESIYFIIKVVDETGASIEGVRVQMCDDAGICKKSVVTGTDGTAGYPYAEGNFHAMLTELPEGYSVDVPDAYYDFVDGVATITLTKNAD